MRALDAPLFVPSLAFAAGAALAPFLAAPPPAPLVVALAALSFALRSRTSTALGFLALGLLASALRAAPADPFPGLDREAPVEAVARVAGPWSRQDDLWQAPGEIVRWRQGGRVATPGAPVRLGAASGWVAEAPYGSRLRIRGYLSRPPALANRVPAPPGPWRLSIKSRALVEIEAAPSLPLRLAAGLRGWIGAGLARTAELARAGEAPPGGGLAMARALVLGDTGGVPEEWKRALRQTGTYHLLSISGLHVAWVVVAVWLATRRLPRRLRLALGVAAALLYLAVVGPQPALLRSAVVVGVLSLALFLERPPAPLNALGAAVLLLVAESPDLALSLSFQLTVAATAGLLVLAPRLAEHWRSAYRLHPWLGRPLAASVGAQLATWPFVLPRFHLLTPFGPLWNLAAIPWSGGALLLSIATAALGLVRPAWAVPGARLLDLWMVPLDELARLPLGVLRPVPILASPVAALLLSLSAAGLLLLPPRRALAALALSASILALSSPHPGAAEDPALAMLDVGQGDAILVRDGERAALIDGGGWRRGGLGARVLLPALLAEGVTRLDAVYMTHPDSDHCSGLAEIGRLLPVARVAMGEGWPAEGCAAELLRLPGARVERLRPGDRRSLGRWRLRVLHAPGEDYVPENERSLVVAAEVRGRRFLLTGDAGRWSEARLEGCCAESLPSDVLKVAHHGSRSSSGESFLRAVAPRLALLSVGERNPYHHPAPEVLERLEEGGARILRTDRLGEVWIAVDGRGRLRLELPGSPKPRADPDPDEPDGSR